MIRVNVKYTNGTEIVYGFETPQDAQAFAERVRIADDVVDVKQIGNAR